MDEKEWTPARGCTIAAGYLVARSAIIAGVSILAGLGFVKACTAMGMVTVHWALPAIFGLLLGAIEAYVLAWKVSESCGLTGRPLILPALVLLAAAQYLAHQVIGAVYPTWDDVMLCLLIPAYGLAMILAGRILIMDS